LGPEKNTDNKYYLWGNAKMDKAIFVLPEKSENASIELIATLVTLSSNKSRLFRKRSIDELLKYLFIPQVRN
jgi:hypothetical protein